MNKHFCLDDSPEFRMVELGEVTSTNDFLRNYRPVGPERRITLVTAEYQTAGRGAGQNHWESEPGKNLLFSLMVHPRHIRPERIFVLSEVLALSIQAALQCSPIMEGDAAGRCKIKWPNDIYWDDRKLCGMLIENDLQGGQIERCILGAGINVNQTEFAFDRDAETDCGAWRNPFRWRKSQGTTWSAALCWRASWNSSPATTAGRGRADRTNCTRCTSVNSTGRTRCTVSSTPKAPSAAPSPMWSPAATS